MEREIKGVWFPIEVWENSELTWNEKILFMEIDSFTSKDKDCYISDEYISNLLSINETSANRILSSLINKGYVTKTKFDGRRRFLKSNLITEVRAGLPQGKSQGCHKGQVRVATRDNIPNTITDNNILKEKEDTIVSKKEIDFKEIMDYWNANTVSFAKVRVASSKVKSSIKSRLKDGYSVDDIKKAIMLCETLPDFYKGKDKGKSWKADFTWLINNTNGNFDKIMTGALHVTSSANKAYQDIINGNISTYKDEYRPTLDGFNMMWSDNVGCYVTTYELNSMMFVDGYKDSERPECAVVMVQGTRYRWNKDANKWVRV